jgi:hypothetical protein
MVGFGSTMTVDVDKMAEENDSFMAAYLDDKVTYQWYKNGEAIEGATDVSYKITSANNGDKFQVVPAKDSKGNDVVYGFNIGKQNANALLSAFINEIKNKDPELNLDKVAGGANIRSLINSINAQTDPEAKSQIIANFITNTINDPVYKDVALQVLDEMNASGVYEGILYRRGKENQPLQDANKKNHEDAFLNSTNENDNKEATGW